MRTCAIINPNSSGGRTRKRWPAIEQKLRARLGEVETRYTTAPMDAVGITRKAVEEGFEQIIAVGGDGTVNEVVNGLIKEDKALNPNVVLALLSSGTGGDFRRTFGIGESVDAQIDHICQGTVRTVDVGKLTFVSDAGETCVRYFDNITSFGLGGVMDRAIAKVTVGRMLGSRLVFQWVMLKTIFKYKNQRVHLQIDDGVDEKLTIKSIAVCNGNYFGGGMHMAPNGEPDDGLFDIIVLGDEGPWYTLFRSQLIYSGKHLDEEKVQSYTGKKVVATPLDPDDHVLIDMDGEAPGRLPATFEIVPRVLKVRS
mgnify:CR=1 FL=1